MMVMRRMNGMLVISDGTETRTTDTWGAACGSDGRPARHMVTGATLHSGRPTPQPLTPSVKVTLTSEREGKEAGDPPGKRRRKRRNWEAGFESERLQV